MPFIKSLEDSREKLLLEIELAVQGLEKTSRFSMSFLVILQRKYMGKDTFLIFPLMLIKVSVILIYHALHQTVMAARRKVK